jgi:anti-sigma regulatory factor (Ser/Thr protein kinase)
VPHDDLEVSASLRLARVPESARLARRFITEFSKASRLSDDDCHTAALLTSELVTNAVRYGGSRATLEARRPSGVLRISVEDDNPELPEEGLAPTYRAESGRGIMLVDALAARWGVERRTGGKAVWFELDV